MDLSEYLSQAIANEMDACVFKKIGPPKKRYCNDFSMDEMVDWDKMEVEQQGGTSTTDKGKEKVSQDATEVVEARRSIIDRGSDIDFDSDDDSDYHSDKSVDYLSPGKEELIELKNRMKANRVAKAKEKGNPISEMNKPNDENGMPVDNVRGDTFEEHDIYMNELLKSLKTADEDGITEDPFTFVKKHVERYPIYDETTHWRLGKPKFKEFLTYYALENGFSLCYERSYEARVVAKCGRRPPRLSDPEKGKQTKQTRYPSASIDEFPTCPWRWYARWMTDEKTFQCISIEDEHTEYEKTVGEHYAMLRSYGKAILDSNPESTVKLGVIVNPDDKTYFDRFYICFAGLADGWKAGHLDLVFGVVGTRLGLQQRKWANFDGLMEAVKDAMPNAEHRGCEGIENGFSECFNSGIVNVRHKPLLTILLKTADEDGITGVPKSYVPAWFEIDMYFLAYHNFVKPVLGMNFWPDQSMYSTVLPPKPKKIHGRPRKKRIRSIGEGGSSSRVYKVGSQASCSNCKKPRHNKASCKEPILEQTPKPKGVSGMKVLVGLEEVLVGLEDVLVGLEDVLVGLEEVHLGLEEVHFGLDEVLVGLEEVMVGLEEVHLDLEKVRLSLKGKLCQVLEHKKDRTQDEDQVEQTQEQAEIDLTQVEQTQEKTQDQVQPQEQPQQVTLRRPSARILQRNLGKQGSSQNTTLNVE
ncbi:hypothetical protein Tco_0658495 [Tanacetum coccineum]